MAYYIYPARPEAKFGRFDFASADADLYWAEHAGNRAELGRLFRSADFSGKRQIESELQICQRKLDYWQRHPNWDRRKAEQTLVKLRKGH